jgi:hypothetical protein
MIKTVQYTKDQIIKYIFYPAPTILGLDFCLRKQKGKKAAVQSNAI